MLKELFSQENLYMGVIIIMGLSFLKSIELTVEHFFRKMNRDDLITTRSCKDKYEGIDSQLKLILANQADLRGRLPIEYVRMEVHDKTISRIEDSIKEIEKNLQRIGDSIESKFEKVYVLIREIRELKE